MSTDQRLAPPPAGVWIPAITFFNREDDTLDVKSQAKYFNYLAGTGIAGLIVLGTNAETALLTTSERGELIKLARHAIGVSFPLTAGVGDNSTKQVLQHINTAAQAGANYALVLPPGYFAKATTPEVILDFYDEVAAKSPLPIIIYNFPGVVNGIDLDTDTIIALAKKHPNIVGVKLSCGKAGKITRLAAALPPSQFATFAGQADFLIPGLSVGSAGCVTAFGNAFPKTVVRIYNLYRAGEYVKALELQRVAGAAEAGVKWGIPAVKYATAVYSARRAGIENAEALLMPRRPYRELGEAQKVVVRGLMKEIAEIEDSL